MFYSDVCRNLRANDPMTFLNLGYLDDPGSVDDAGIDMSDRMSERLYDRIVGDADLAEREVVEVGCGAGAGSAHMARTHRPASLVGVDINKDMIDYCREHYDLANLQFLQGDALDLPITSDSVDVVINVESSHCYPSRARFFEEVARVLRPGGSFLFADLIFANGRSDGLDVVSAELGDAGLTIEDRIDITENVLAARDAVSKSSFRSRIVADKPPLKAAVTEDMMFLTGSRNYKQMASRKVQYAHWRTVKPPASPVVAGMAEAAAG